MISWSDGFNNKLDFYGKSKPNLILVGVFDKIPAKYACFSCLVVFFIFSIANGFFLNFLI